MKIINENFTQEFSSISNDTSKGEGTGELLMCITRDDHPNIY